jgi:citrate lyase beta subunit
MIVNPWALGATLYLPATRDDLAAVLLARRHPALRSAVICLEDAVRACEVGPALVNVQRLLDALDAFPSQELRPAIFIRPRDAAMLAHVLRFPAIDKVDGVVIPKATADNLPAYLGVLAYDHHTIMPTLETRDVFDPVEMRRLREQLLAVQERVLAIRIGGNDLLQTLGARRSRVRTAYDGPLGHVIAGLVATYSPWGFALSAPVFEYFGNPALLREEVERDLEHGLLTKTAIHPCQIDVIQSVYAVDDTSHAEAQAVLALEGPAVFASRQAMCEPATHHRWAQSIVRRADTFGVRNAPAPAPMAALIEALALPGLDHSAVRAVPAAIAGSEPPAPR